MKPAGKRVIRKQNSDVNMVWMEFWNKLREIFSLKVGICLWIKENLILRENVRHKAKIWTFIRMWICCQFCRTTCLIRQSLISKNISLNLLLIERRNSIRMSNCCKLCRTISLMNQFLKFKNKSYLCLGKTKNMKFNLDIKLL